jgi:hypothetical protein
MPSGNQTTNDVVTQLPRLLTSAPTKFPAPRRKPPDQTESPDSLDLVLILFLALILSQKRSIFSAPPTQAGENEHEEEYGGKIS